MSYIERLDMTSEEPGKACGIVSASQIGYEPHAFPTFWVGNRLHISPSEETTLWFLWCLYRSTRTSVPPNTIVSGK